MKYTKYIQNEYKLRLLNKIRVSINMAYQKRTNIKWSPLEPRVKTLRHSAHFDSSNRSKKNYTRSRLVNSSNPHLNIAPTLPVINQKLINLHRICKINHIKLYIFNNRLYASDKKSEPDFDTYIDNFTGKKRLVNIDAMFLFGKCNFISKSVQKLDFVSKKYQKCEDIYIKNEDFIIIIFRVRTPKNGNYVKLYIPKYNYKCIITKFYMLELFNIIRNFSKRMLIQYYS